MKHQNSLFVFARLMLVVLTLAISVFSFASCDGLPPALQGILGGNPNESCEHAYDNACDADCNTCGATRATEHTYDNACDTDCNVCGVTRTIEHTYDNACDTDCNTCGATRTTEHAYANGVCGVCGAVDDSVPACEHTTVENCVCKDCNQPVHTELDCMPAMAPTCGEFGLRSDLYICQDCEAIFSDEACKNEVTTIANVVIPKLGHVRVGDTCERCGHISNVHSGDSPDQDPWHLAANYLYNLYRADNKKATPSDYELISKVVIEDKEFAVTWVIANESITLTYDETKGVYVVDIPDEVAKNCYYSIEATIHNSETGRFAKYQFVRLLEATVTDDGNATECRHKNAEYIAATDDVDCNDFNVLFDLYVCCDCIKVFFDAECKNEVPLSTDIAYTPQGHKTVGGICEICGYYSAEGVLPSHPSNPTPLESAYFDLIELYYANHKEATPSDYELVSKITIDGEEFAVTWTVANESITVSYDADKDAYVVNVPDEVNEKCYYTITATISDGEGNSYSFTFARVLVPTAE